MGYFFYFYAHSIFGYMKDKTALNTFRSSILAGMAIAFGGFAYAAVGGIIGALLFTFGLLTVVHYGWKLYTGAIGFIHGIKELWPTFIVLAGNIVGCLAVALIARVSPMEISSASEKILQARFATGIWQCGLLAIGCGFVVTTAVCFGRQGKFLPLLFGVPLFISCGFPHCIADAFYYLACPWDVLASRAAELILLYISIVLGNFIGCNLYRIILPQDKA